MTLYDKSGKTITDAISEGTQQLLDDICQVLRDNGAKGHHIASLILDMRDQRDAAIAEAAAHKAEVERIKSLINTPVLDEFFSAVRIEQAHQKEKWGDAHDANKTPGDWSLLFHYILGKQAHAVFENDRDKYRHHLITMAAICFSAHRCDALATTPTAKETE